MIHDDSTTDRIPRFDDAITAPHRRENGSGFVLLIILGFAAVFWFAWVCTL